MPAGSTLPTLSPSPLELAAGQLQQAQGRLGCLPFPPLPYSNSSLDRHPWAASDRLLGSLAFLCAQPAHPAFLRVPPSPVQLLGTHPDSWRKDSWPWASSTIVSWNFICKGARREPGRTMDPVSQVGPEATWEGWGLLRDPLWLNKGTLKLFPKAFSFSSFCFFHPKLASAGTFQALKEPLAFLRTLELVSCGAPWGPTGAAAWHSNEAGLLRSGQFASFSIPALGPRFRDPRSEVGLWTCRRGVISPQFLLTNMYALGP